MFRPLRHPERKIGNRGLPFSFAPKKISLKKIKHTLGMDGNLIHRVFFIHSGAACGRTCVRLKSWGRVGLIIRKGKRLDLIFPLLFAQERDVIVKGP